MKNFVMKKCTVLFLIVLMTVFCVSQVQADLVENGLFLVDTDTDLVWLDLTATSNMSYADVSTILSNGGTTTGTTPVTMTAGEFRYATEDEVHDLWINAGIPEPYDGVPTVDKYDPVRDLQYKIGQLYVQSYVSHSWALYGDGTNQAHLTQKKSWDPRQGGAELPFGSLWDYYNRASYLVATTTPSGLIIYQQGLINDIIDGQIGFLVELGLLKPGQANGLINPLGNAIDSLGAGHVDAACSQIQDFIDEVYEKIADGALIEDAGEWLIETADEIMYLIGCN